MDATVNTLVLLALLRAIQDEARKAEQEGRRAVVPQVT